MKMCRSFAGETDTVVEFDFDGRCPSDMGIDPKFHRTLANTDSHVIHVLAIDKEGNRYPNFGFNPFILTVNRESPVFTDGSRTTRTVDENTVAGQNIGTAISATDAENNTLTYSLGGTDAASFSIVSTTGQLQTKAALDYETKATYTVTVTVSDGNFTNSITVTINVNNLGPACDVAPSVSRAIVNAVPGVSDCRDVTETHLAAITRLVVNASTTLKAGDFSGLSSLDTLSISGDKLATLPEDLFDGLTALEELRLSDTQLTTLPEDLFDGLTALERLDLYNNQLTTLPEDLFDGLTALEELWLSNNQLTTLPEDLFDGLTALQWLYLPNNQLATLPEGIFDGLSSLWGLNLLNNQLTTLPEGIFDGLSSLFPNYLRLGGNTVDPLPITVSLEGVGGGQFKAVAPTGAPFNIVLPLTVANGSINGGVTTITISKGSVESAPLTVTRTPGTTAAVTVDIGILPGPPRSNLGYTLVKSADSAGGTHTIRRNL